MKRTAVIMAGGSGERFWPLSRRRQPKQLLNLSSEEASLIEESIERIKPIIPLQDIFIITGALLLEPLRRALPELPPENVVAEPHKRNTAPCLALAAAFIACRYAVEGLSPEDISVAVLTADQIIQPAENFGTTVTSALDYVERVPAVGTIGIVPVRAEIGYGYIETSDLIEHAPGGVDILAAARFKEKPDSQAARQMLEAGNFLWNSGMFFWRLDTFIDNMKRHLPEVGSKIAEIQSKYRNKTNIPLPEPLESISEIFYGFPDISIDYGLMEKAEWVVVAKATFSWDDVGSWDSLERVRPKDASGNILSGNTVLVDTKESVIFNASQKGDKIVATLGLDGFVVVLTDDAVLVCPKNRVQEVKKCVEKIKSNNGDKWL